MNDFIKKIFEAYENEYGKGEKLQDGEIQVFELKDCTVVSITGYDFHSLFPPGFNGIFPSALLYKQVPVHGSGH